MTSHPIAKRLPIRCEPCRKRKIKCTRGRRPCQTCLRRGLRAADCIFLGQPRLLLDDDSQTETNVQRELLGRIRNLKIYSIDGSIRSYHRRIVTQSPLLSQQTAIQCQSKNPTAYSQNRHHTAQ
jgi:Fungal Zn(2)-Cys(6) binuclear cluster domain.